ncbi:MAG TPA: aminotransferase class III-fold pyridoxal phosphate-dependent enzyme [Gemmatimonadales bacterium]|nr:aminotransferase class III-fold pyridoxal phosphate-dependent enzyme [Gemmatimonadales bacterium]
MLNGKAWLPVYAQMPLTAVSGHGSWLVDDRGNEWLDAYGGHAVASTGHCHPHVVQALKDQAATLIFYSTAVPHRLREELADRIAERCPGDLSRVFFCNSGAEANENALGLARKITGRQKIVSVAGGWHGRTAACLAVTDGAKYEAGALRAGLPLSVKVPFNDPAAMAAAVDGSVAAVIVEPVQGLTGARDCSVAFLQAARRACDQAGAVLIFDEIQCGVGRLGAFTAAEYFGVTPDVITMAKGLASGVPIGAMVATSAATSGLHLGDLGSTFGGGPLASAAALATLEVIDQDGLLDNVATVSTYLKAGAGRLRLPVQGQGLLLGLQTPRPAAEVQQALFGQRVLTGTASDPAMLRLLPPLSFSIGEADLLLDALQRVLQ